MSVAGSLHVMACSGPSAVPDWPAIGSVQYQAWWLQLNTHVHHLSALDMPFRRSMGWGGWWQSMMTNDVSGWIALCHLAWSGSRAVPACPAIGRVQYQAWWLQLNTHVHHLSALDVPFRRCGCLGICAARHQVVQTSDALCAMRCGGAERTLPTGPPSAESISKRAGFSLTHPRAQASRGGCM